MSNKTNDGDSLVFPGEGISFDIYSWCPTPEPTVPPTQVHLHLTLGDELPRLVIRFKGPGTLDKLIAALQDHRDDVFGAKNRGAV